MKQYTTRFLKTVAAIYIGFPILHIIVLGVLFDIPLGRCGAILLSPFYYVVASVAVASGYGLWEMRRWSWYLFVTTNFMIGYETAVVANLYGESHHKVVAFLGVVSVLAAITYRVAREVRVPYFFPKIRWWESDPRYKLSVPVVLRRNGSDVTIEGQILDLSFSGCFIKLRSEMEPDEEVTLAFTVFGYAVSCSGNVVWCTQSTVTHPRGIGVKFGALGRLERRHLRYINRRLKKIANFYRRSRYLLNQDEFIKRLGELESAPPTKFEARANSKVGAKPS